MAKKSTKVVLRRELESSFRLRSFAIQYTSDRCLSRRVGGPRDDRGLSPPSQTTQMGRVAHPAGWVPEKQSRLLLQKLTQHLPSLVDNGMRVPNESTQVNT